MPNTAEVKRRHLMRVCQAIIDLDLQDPRLPERLEALKKRAGLAMTEVKNTRGNPVVSDLARERSAETRRQISAAFRERILPVIKQVRATGHHTPDAIAKALNARGLRTPKDNKWTRHSVRSFLAEP